MLYLCTRMIKKHLHIWMMLAASAMLLICCGRAPQYDSRLVEADSLVYVSEPPTKALDLLSSIEPSSLNDEADKAYHALLITQARYKCYSVFTSDEEINSALAYYEHHRTENDKLTSAYIYKGAVMEELGKPDTAMLFYKQASVNATEENDYFNMGYALLRMGKLYHAHHAYDGRDIEKLEQALDCFRKAGDAHYQIICLKDLGALYRSTDSEKAEKMLNEAISLTEKENDTINQVGCLNTLAYAFFMKGDADKAANKKAYQVLQRIKPLGMNGLPFNVYTTFASVYANLGMPDSADYFLQFAKLDYGTDSTLYLEAKSKIAKARGDMLNFYKFSHISDSTSFSTSLRHDIVNIMYAELSFDKEYSAKLEKQRRKRSYIIASIVGAIILSLLLLALYLYRRTHRYDKLIVELKDQSQSQMNDLMDLQGNINELKIKDENLTGFISSHMSMMREMIDACYHEPNNRIAEDMKRIVKFQDSNRDNWVKLYDYIDLEHNNIMTRTRQQYPQLNDRDLLLLALTSMGFTYIQTAIVMGYSNATSVSVLKQRLAQKMGIDCSLNEYIKRYSVHENDG